MSNLMKLLTSAMTLVLVVITPNVALAVPADPGGGANIVASGHTSYSYETVRIGDYISLNYACQDAWPQSDWVVTTIEWNTTGSIPLGLTLDTTTFTISGIPQQGSAGVYELLPIRCHAEGYGQSIDMDVETGRIEVQNPTLDHSQVTGGGHTALTEQHITVGQYVELDYNCVDSNPNSGNTIFTNGWSSLPQIPEGMYFDGMNNKIVGTPTATAFILLPAVICRVTRLGYSEDLYKQLGSLVVDAETSPPVDPPTPPDTPVPAAAMTITPLHDSQCSFVVDVHYPDGYPADEDSPRLVISNGDKSLTLAGLDPYEHSSDKISIFKFGLEQKRFGNWQYSSQVDESNQNLCFDYLSFTLTFESEGVSSAAEIVQDVYVSTQLADYIEAGKEFTNTCSINFYLKTAATPDINQASGNRSVLVYYEEFENGIETFQVIIRVDDVPLDQSIHFTYQPTNRRLDEHGPQADFLHIVSQIGISKGCQANADVYFDYTSDGDGMGSENWSPALPSCGKGTFSASGFDWYGTPCRDASIGHYVDTKGATEERSCPPGMTTESEGTASINDCYTPILQTTTKLSSLKGFKLKSVNTIQANTDQGTALRITASGACTVTETRVKNTRVIKVTASKTAGICTLQVSAPGGYHMPAFANTLVIKVSKTGK